MAGGHLVHHAWKVMTRLGPTDFWHTNLTNDTEQSNNTKNMDKTWKTKAKPSSMKRQQTRTPCTFKWKPRPKLQGIFYCIYKITTLPRVVLDILLNAYNAFLGCRLEFSLNMYCLTTGNLQNNLHRKAGHSTTCMTQVTHYSIFLTRGCFKSQNPK